MHINEEKYSKIRNKFSEAYKNEILPILISMEGIRSQYLKKARLLKLAFMTPLVFIVLPFVFWYCFGKNEQFSEYGDYHFVSVLFGCMCILGATLLILVLQFSGEVFSNLNKKFQKEIKNHCLSKVLRSLGDIKRAVYTNEDKTMIEKSGLGFSTNSEKSNIKCDDCFRGEYNGVEFKLLEISNSENPFGRLIISFASNKNIKAPAIIGPKYSINTSERKHCDLLWPLLMVQIGALFLFGSTLYYQNPDGLTFSELLSSPYNIFVLVLSCCTLFTICRLIYGLVTSEDKMVKLEDGNIDVYSEDEVEVRYLISPVFIERFQNLQKTYGSSVVRCAFFEDRIMFEICGKKDFFELGSIWIPMDNPYFIDNFRNEIIAIYDMIDYFKLDEKTGL